MATKKRLSLIYELDNFANTYFGKVTKFQVDGLFRFGVLSNLLAWRWKPPPGANRVNPIQAMVFCYHFGWGTLCPLRFSFICCPITTKLGMTVL